MQHTRSQTTHIVIPTTLLSPQQAAQISILLNQVNFKPAPAQWYYRDFNAAKV